MSILQGIYGLCDNSFAPGETQVSLAEKLLKGGVKTLQLRMKGEENLQLIKDQAESIIRLKNSYDFTFIINDFVEIALDLGVDGIHVGQDDMKIAQIRSLSKKKILIGYSSHSFEEAKEAEKQGADYVALGAIFPTPTKGPGHPVVGINTLEQVVQSLNIPVVAIGGITRENFMDVRNTGVDAIAMISALTKVEDIPAAAKWFTEKWGE